MEWLRSGEAARIISAIREEATGRQQLAARALSGYPFAAHAKGHHLWLPLPDRWNRSAFVAELFRQGLAVVGSEAFAVGEPLPHAVRLCLGAARNRAELGTALQLLTRTLSRSALPTQVV
jgi:DNA-binding transcriptional MocR family regulator